MQGALVQLRTQVTSSRQALSLSALLVWDLIAELLLKRLSVVFAIAPSVFVIPSSVLRECFLCLSLSLRLFL
jgi:hypothetical protein